MNKTLFNAMFAIAVLIFVGAWFYSDTIEPNYSTEAEAQPEAILDRIRPVSETVMTRTMLPQGNDGKVTAMVTAVVAKPSATPVIVTDKIEEPAATNASTPPAGDAASKLGEGTYASACFACHTTGVAGSPKVGDLEAWAPRLAQGTAMLNEHALKGFQGSTGIMPAKGGRVDLSDEAIIAAVAYMIAQSGGQ